jgi:hypothetical protein
MLTLYITTLSATVIQMFLFSRERLFLGRKNTVGGIYRPPPPAQVMRMGGLNVPLKRVSGTRGPPRNTVRYFRVSRFCTILKII